MFESISIGGKGTPGAVIFGCFQGQRPDERTLGAAGEHGLESAIREAVARPEFTGEAGGVVECFAPGRGSAPGVRGLVVGLGAKEEFKACVLRAGAAAAGRRLAAARAPSVSVELEGVLRAVRADLHVAGNAFGEGIGLLGWVCDEFRGTATKDPKRAGLTLRAPDRRFEAGLERGLSLARSTNFCRTLSQTPPNIATPYWMAEQSRKLAKREGLSCRVIRGDELEREGLTGLINVGKASENKPCLIRLEYRPGARGRGAGRPVVLIGKTVCYDTGGLSLKINNGMVGMKRDKDGGCAVLGAMHAIATVIRPKRPVVALLAAAENSISDGAYRPDDVLRYRNGVTVEVTNTDAEGRLVLADALCWACEKEDPASIIDLATLTGGVVVALGSTFAGMFCEDDRLRRRVEEAAAAAGERVWRLPMHREYREMMKSPVADVVNSNPNRKAHPIQGAAFLSYFVEERVPWCHLDIAGVHAVEKSAGMFIEGPTGWGVRLLANLLDAE